MGVNYHSYLYLGFKLSEHLEIDVKEEKYFKFDPKTGQKTNEEVVEKTIYTLKVGDRTTSQEAKGRGELRYYEETYEDLLGIGYTDKDNLKIFMDYDDPDNSVVGFQLFKGSYYSDDTKNSYTIEELIEKSKKLKQLIKERIGLDIEPEVHSLSYAG